MPQLSLATRPRTLAQFVGQEKLVKQIRNIIAEVGKDGSMPKAWLFGGPLGTGKTSMAKIIALSYQCTHQNGEWGMPCKECYAARTNFEIHEIPAAKITGKKEIEQELAGSELYPFTGSKYRIYILDECHKMSDGAQNLTLKYLEEDTPDTTIFILCSTEPENIIETLRSRCYAFSLRELDTDGITTIVSRLLKRVKSDLPVDRLVDVLVERGVKYPRFICHAVTKYAGGTDPEEAAIVDVIQDVDVKALTRSLIKGDWISVSKYLINAQSVDIKSIRIGVIAYLRVILLETPEIGSTAKATAKALSNICSLQNTDNLTLSASLSAELYNLCELFSRFPR